MGGAAAVAGLGLSAVSTVNKINQQQERAEARRQQLETQNMLARDQLELSKAKFEQNKELSQKQYQEMLQVIDAQERQAQKTAEARKIQQRTALLQTQAQAELVEERAKQNAIQILAQNQNRQQKNLQQQQAQQKQIEQLGERSQQITEKQQQARAQERQQDAADSAIDTSLQGAVNPDAVEAQQEVGEAQRRSQTNINNLELRRRAGQFFAKKRANLVREMGQDSAEFIREQADRQKRAFEIQNELNRQNIKFGTKQNRLGAQASFFANQASRNVKQASRFIQTQGRIAQNNAKKSMIEGPGFLDVATAGAKIAGQAVNSGIIGPQQPQSGGGTANISAGITSTGTRFSQNPSFGQSGVLSSGQGFTGNTTSLGGL